MREQWSEISENLKKMLHSGVFKVWIAPLQAQVHAGGLLLTAPNAFVASWLEGKMLSTLREAAVSPLIWIFSLVPASLSVVFAHSNGWLIGSFVLSAGLYAVFYAKLVHFGWKLTKSRF